MTACRLMPRFAAAHSNLGSILKEQGKSQQAIAHYQQAIDIDPMFAGAYSNLGSAYKDSGRMEDAIKCFTSECFQLHLCCRSLLYLPYNIYNLSI